jgi:hypothetical protein
VNNAIPPEYLRQLLTMTKALQAWLECKPRAPRFLLGPDDVTIVAELDEVEARICRNEEAHEVCKLMVDTLLATEGPHHRPTLVMLDVVLQAVEIPVERGTLKQLGLRVLDKGGSA